MLMKNKEIGGETVCLTQIQIIDYDSFFRLQNILPHILPHIKIRVTEDISLSALDLIKGGTEKGPPSPSKNLFHLLLN